MYIILEIDICTAVFIIYRNILAEGGFWKAGLLRLDYKIFEIYLKNMYTLNIIKGKYSSIQEIGKIFCICAGVLPGTNKFIFIILPGLTL